MADDPKRLAQILERTKKTLKDAAAVNTTRYALGKSLQSFGLPVSFHSGGQTKYNRIQQGYTKDHWLDAACVGDTGAHVFIPPRLKPLSIQAMGRGSRQVCRIDRFGFPRTYAKQVKRVHGFQTGDMVKAVVTSGKKTGTYVGRIAVHTSGSFNIATGKQTVQGISYRYCRLVQRLDGFQYSFGLGKHIRSATSSPG